MTLVADCSINVKDELLYDYEDEYNLNSISPVTEIFNVCMNLKLPMSNVTDKWSDRTEGTGFCGILSIVQALFREELNGSDDVGTAYVINTYENGITYGKKLRLQNPKDREFLIVKMCLMLNSILEVHIRDKFEEQLQFLANIRSDAVVPFQDIQLEAKSWLPTTFVCHDPGMFLGEYKIFLWREMNDEIHKFRGEFQNYGSNFSKSNLFTYNEWKTNIFDATVVHIYHSSSHFFTGDEYDSRFFHIELDVAVEDAISNLIRFLTACS